MSAAIGIIPPERCFPRKFHAYGVERDEAMLKVWETLADRGKALARKLDDRLDELRELGFRGAAEFMSMERGRLRAGTSDAELMQGKMDELQTTIEQVAGLAEVLKSFKDLAAERRTEISELLKSYRPEAGQMSEERQSVQRVVDLLGRIDDDWPPPGAGNLRTYLRRLQAFAEQSHAGRLRMRLAQIVGLPVISTSTLLDTDDVADIEEQWPVLWDEFARACDREANAPRQPTFRRAAAGAGRRDTGMDNTSSRETFRSSRRSRLTRACAPAISESLSVRWQCGDR